MSITALFIGIWAWVLAWFGFAVTQDELTDPSTEKLPGGTTLSPSSVNWLVAFAFIGAMVICLFT